MQTVQYLKSIYPCDTPILLKDIRIGRKSKSAIKQDLYRAAKRGEIARDSRGLYFIPSKEKNKGFLQFNQILEKRYIQDDWGYPGLDINIYGFYSGNTFANQLGLSLQVPAMREITTNKTSSKKRVTTVAGRKVILRKSRVEITFQNWRILQFLELFSYVSLDEIRENRSLLIQYIQKHLDKQSLIKYIRFYPPKALKTIVEEDLFDAFR